MHHARPEEQDEPVYPPLPQLKLYKANEKYDPFLIFPGESSSPSY